MKKFFLSLLLAGSALAAGAENLVLNSNFEAEGKTFPPFWQTLHYAGNRVDYFRSGGPENRPFIRLSTTGKDYAIELHQNNLKLVKGEKYRLSAWIRTRNVQNKESGIRVGSSSRVKLTDNAIFGLPVNQAEWKFYQRDIVMDKEIDPLYDYYSVVVHLIGERAQLDVAGITLEPLTEKARLNSCSQMDNMARSLVPLGNLHYLDAAKPNLDIILVGPFEGEAADYECEAAFKVSGKSCRVPFKRGRFNMNFSGVLKPGIRDEMTLKLVNRRSGKVLFAESYPVRSMFIPELPASARQLNNMVTELYNAQLSEGQTVTVPNNRFGFMLFRFIPENGKNFEVFMDGKKLFDQSAWQSEVIRNLDPGNYTLTVKGDSGRLVVRLIPDVMTFAMWAPRLPDNGPYNWEFAKKYIFPGLTTLNIGGFSDAEFAEYNRMGRIYLENYGIQNWSNPNIAEDDLARMQKDRVFRNPENHGTTMDESECFYPVMLDAYAWALKHFKNPYNKLIVTYQIGPISESYLNAISASANASNGRGYLAFEVYPRGQETLEDMKNMIDNAASQWDIFRDAAPGLFDKAGLAWGSFSCPPNISLYHYPDVDYKYVLDMKMHAAANHPSFKGLAKVAFWGSYASDEEIVRWSFRLMRHYAFEGNKEMLSDRYGFKFHPGLLKNPSFTDGLNHWQCRGDVSVDSFPGYGKNSMFLHGSRSWGDTFALLRKSKGQSAELKQDAVKLVPGKKYVLNFHVGDYDDVICNRQRPGALPLEIKLDGAGNIRHTHYIGNHTKGKYAYINIHRIIFTAEKDTVTLTFSNAKAPDSSALMLNQVALRPYYDAEEY